MTKACVLVTGGSGFIGSHCLQALQGAGLELHAARLTSDAPSDAGVTWHTADLLSDQDRARLMERVRPTHLLHLAWNVEPGRYWTSDTNYDWLKASIDLTERFHEQGGRRAVFAGTCAEYDWADGRCSETETALNPATTYGQCKKSLHDAVATMAEETELSWAWGRIFFVYGPGERPNRLVPYVIRSLLKGEEALCSSGVQARDFTHVQDLGSGFAALLQSDLQGAVNLASGEAVALKTIIQAIAELLEREDLVRLGARPDRANDPPLLVADTQRLFNELGWRPGLDLLHGLRTTVDWWRARDLG